MKQVVQHAHRLIDVVDTGSLGSCATVVWQTFGIYLLFCSGTGLRELHSKLY